MPVTQAEFGPQENPHWPQLLGSALASTHAPPHMVVAPWHVDWQTPAEQVAPAAQALPHVPQFCESVARSVVWTSPTVEAWPSDTVTGSGAAVVGWPAWVASTLYVPGSTCEIANAPSAPVIARNDVPGANTKVPAKSCGVHETTRPSMLPPSGPAGPWAPVAP